MSFGSLHASPTKAALYGVAIECSFKQEMAAELTGCEQVTPADLNGQTASVDLLFGI